MEVDLGLRVARGAAAVAAAGVGEDVEAVAELEDSATPESDFDTEVENGRGPEEVAETTVSVVAETAERKMP